MNNKKNRKGFTIVELVIVIAVIAILATVLVPTFGNVITKANESKAVQAARNEFTEYMIDHAQEGAFDAIVYVDATHVYTIDDGNFVLDDGNLKNHGSYDAAKTALAAADGSRWPATATEGVIRQEPATQGGT